MDEKKIQSKKTERSKSKTKSAKKSAPAAPKKNPQGDIVFALDIGTRTVVGVLAKKTPHGCKIIDIETVAHEKRSMSDGQIEDIKSVADDIKRVRRELENRRHIALTNVCIAAAGRALKTLRASWEYKLPEEKTITAEAIKAAELDAVRRTCASFSQKNDSAAFYCVGHSVVSLSLDGFKVQKPEGHRGERLTTEIIAAFLPAYVVDSLVAAVDAAHLEVSSLTLEPIAAMNAVIPQELRLINLALCDIGAGTSDVAVSRDGSVVAYGMATTAGDEITEALMRELLVDFNTAEMIKISSEKEITYKNILMIENKITRERVDQIIAPAAHDLAKVIAEEILTANATPPQAVFLVGGGSKLNGLAQMVADELDVDISRVITGSRETLRGIIAPEEMILGAEHSTPLGIAVSAGEGVSYDFTTITINGKKLRAPDTNRLTVFELLSVVKIKPENMLAGAGKTISFTLLGEKITLRGEPPKPSEITVNGEPASLNTAVTKGDDVRVIPAEKGADGAAKLSDYFDMSEIKMFTVTLFGKKLRAGRFIRLNGKETALDRRINDSDTVELSELETLGKLLAANDVSEGVLLNDKPADIDTLLKSGDIITYEFPPEGENSTPAPEPPKAPALKAPEPKPAAPKAAEAAATKAAAPEKNTEHSSQNPTITVNGIQAEFPMRADGKPPIFLDVAKAFSENPTELLTHADTITVNGKIARLDEEIHNGDVIIIE